MAFEALLWCGLGIGVALPPLLALRGARLALAVLSGALSPLVIGLAFLASLVGSWGDVRYSGSEDYSRSVVLAIASIFSAATWAAGTALAVVVAMLRDRRRARDGAAG